ncbi:TPM domain-containing protein [Leptospira sp. 96542]|nr:TPM domain-containing protein [Leptospira sp. 96542]
MFRLVIGFFIFINLSLVAREVPRLSSRITDETWTLSQDYLQFLERKLLDHESKTSNQVAVLMISSLEGEILESYSMKVVENWRLGRKGKDNGVLLLIAKDDRVLRIEVGYGLEGNLTDILCRHIIEKEIKPFFKQGKFEEGISSGVNAILGAIDGTYSVPEPKDYSYLGPLEFLGEIGGGVEENPIPWAFLVPITLFVLTILGVFTYVAAHTPYVGWFIYFFLFPFWSIFPTALYGPNIGACVFLSYAVFVGLYKIYHLVTPHGRKRMKKIGIVTGGSGGSRSGSGGGGFSSSSSGGFRGGGGSFGGGGSSGSW